MGINFCIVIPAFREEKSLPKLLAELNTFASQQKELGNHFTVAIVNDCSPDKTKTIALLTQTSFPKIVLDLPVNLGIGGAVQCGYRFAFHESFDAVLQIDADGQHPPLEISKLLAAFRETVADLVIGSRYLKNEKSKFQSSILRRLGISWFSWLIQLLSRKRISDPTSGMRLISRKLLKHFAEDYPQDYPEPETNAWAARRGYKVIEVPVQMRERQGGLSSIQGWQPIYYMVKVSLAIVMGHLSALRSERP